MNPLHLTSCLLLLVQQYKLGKHRSNALELVQKKPVIEVEGNMAVCDGGGGALGHPLEYIKLGKRADYSSDWNEEDGVPCIYCGLRYRSKGGGHHH
jgi:NADH dehydrogenase (ubiquinone) Fe-S protein 6